MLIRSFLSHLHLEILKRTRPPFSTFNFQSASIGNLFLTGARLFSGSFESAIYLLTIIGGVDESKTTVLPAITSNFSHHISAGLVDGTIVTGQNAISHPSEPSAPIQRFESDQLPAKPLSPPSGVDATVEDATLPGSLPTLRQPAIAFSKDAEQPLPSRIERIWYINPYGQEMRPPPNPKVLEAITSADALIYSIGSLYTSIVPSLILRGVGARIASSRGPRFKILILNGSLDRETPGYTASDFLTAITRACIDSQVLGSPLETHHAEGASEQQQQQQQEEERQRRRSMDLSPSWCTYVTHVIHLEGEGTPKVDKLELAKMGVETIRLYGRKGDGGAARYDERALSQALSAILGKRERSERSRRNTGS